MKIKQNFSLVSDGEQYFAVSDDAENEKKRISLPNERAVFMWNYLLQNDCNKEQLLHALLDACDISTVLALNDIDLFLRSLNGIIEL